MTFWAALVFLGLSDVWAWGTRRPFSQMIIPARRTSTAVEAAAGATCFRRRLRGQFPLDLMLAGAARRDARLFMLIIGLG
eukprot:2262934-Pyramimonas_sp.AAC.1